MDTFHESKDECRARYIKNLLVFLALCLIIICVDVFFLSKIMELGWESYIFTFFIFVFVFLWPRKPHLVHLSEIEISTTDKAYPLSNITKIVLNKHKLVIHAKGMKVWQIPMYQALAELPVKAQKLNPNIEVEHAT